ncbi:hypothetical protein FRC06_009081 [Ceratobasidium sp. 370]|nr:hypothetical protein FRC06_009081 [Ceratobasidium sp. 370]
MVHFWLGTKILIKIFEMAGVEHHVVVAKAFLNCMMDIGIPVEGQFEAVEYWEALHTQEQALLVLLVLLVAKDFPMFGMI